MSPRPVKLALAALSAAVVSASGFLAGTTLIAASISPPAQGKGAGCGPGPIHCSVDQTDAFAFWFNNAPPFASASVNPTRTQFVVRPRGGPAFVSPVETAVNIFVFSPTVNASDCFIVPDSAFIVSTDLQKATLHATLNNECSAQLTPLLADVQAVPNAPGPPPPPPGPNPLVGTTVNISWTGPGEPFVGTTSASTHCSGFTSTFHVNSKSTPSIASGTLTFPDGTVLTLGSSQGAGADQFDSQQSSNGVPGPTCIFAP